MGLHTRTREDPAVQPRGMVDVRQREQHDRSEADHDRESGAPPSPPHIDQFVDGPPHGLRLARRLALHPGVFDGRFALHP